MASDGQQEDSRTWQTRVHGKVKADCKHCSGFPDGRIERFCMKCNGCPSFTSLRIADSAAGVRMGTASADARKCKAWLHKHTIDRASRPFPKWHMSNCTCCRQTDWAGQDIRQFEFQSCSPASSRQRMIWQPRTRNRDSLGNEPLHRRGTQ